MPCAESTIFQPPLMGRERAASMGGLLDGFGLTCRICGRAAPGNSLSISDRGANPMSASREFRVRIPEKLAVSIDRESAAMGLSRAGLVKLACSTYLGGNLSSYRRGAPPLPRKLAVASPNLDTNRG